MGKNTQQYAMPFLKWAGGKNQLLKKFQDYYPPELANHTIRNYYEPFAGSGAVFFDILRHFNIKYAWLCDNNEELILTYRVIQKNPDALIEHLDKISKKYLKLSGEQRTKQYYEFRHRFNQQKKDINFRRYSRKWIPRAALVIFFNRTCFNGLFRMNASGEFNTPAGSYKNPRILDAGNLLNVSKALSIAEIKQADFSEVKKVLKPDSFVYFDPPYRPISKTSSFTTYTGKGFDDKAQRKLARVFFDLHHKGAKIMLSNSDPKNHNPRDDFFDRLYKDFYIQRILARRSINSDAKKRGEIKEIVITNYKT